MVIEEMALAGEMKKELDRCQFFESGAENGIRTRGPQLGKLMLYQLSYFRLLLVLGMQI